MEPSPLWILRCPTLTPSTSVIALLVPRGSKPILRPKSVDRGLSWACFEVIALSSTHYISFYLKGISFFSGLQAG